MTVRHQIPTTKTVSTEALDASTAGSARQPVTTAFAAALAGYTVSIGLVEALLAFGDVTVGFAGHAVLILLLLVHYALNSRSRPARILPVLALLPLMRILSLTMIFQELIPLYWYVLIGAPVLSAAVLAAQVLGLDETDLGLGATRLLPQVAIALSGIGLGIAARFLLQPTPIFGQIDWLTLAMGAAVLTVFVALVEEIIFRGMLQRIVDELFPRAGIYLVNVLFALMYLGTHSASAVIFFGLTGLYFSWCVRRTGATWGVILAHSILASSLLLLPNM